MVLNTYKIIFHHPFGCAEFIHKSEVHPLSDAEFVRKRTELAKDLSVVYRRNIDKSEITYIVIAPFKP